MRGDDECAYMLTTPLVQLMLSTALNSLVDAFNLLLRGQLEKRAVLENLDLILLCLDEAVDDGCVFTFILLPVVVLPPVHLI